MQKKNVNVQESLQPTWSVVDVKDQVLGRVSTNIAQILTGKSKPSYTPHLLSGDFVIVINSRHVKLTGKKTDQKVYIKHTGRPGRRKEISFSQMLTKNPNMIIYNSVRGMLPKNKLRKYMLKRLRIYSDGEHPHQAQLR